jgi:hypothetical protein
MFAGKCAKSCIPFGLKDKWINAKCVDTAALVLFAPFVYTKSQALPK